MATKVDYQALSGEIMSRIGGEENVFSVVHCATRLRFVLKDRAKANGDDIKKLPGVITVGLFISPNSATRPRAVVIPIPLICVIFSTSGNFSHKFSIVFAISSMSKFNSLYRLNK